MWREELWKRLEEQAEWLAMRTAEEKLESSQRLPPATYTVAVQDDNKDEVEERHKLCWLYLPPKLTACTIIQSEIVTDSNVAILSQPAECGG